MQNSPSHWDPALYMKFQNERTQPALDLVNRIGLANPRRILDVGSGPGTSTAVLAARWPEAKITGIDNSEVMIAEARVKYPQIVWQIADAATFRPAERFDIVFANAVIHWVPDHEKLIRELFNLTTDTGVLAVQVPMTAEMKFAELVESVFRKVLPNSAFDIASRIHYHPAPFYLDVLASLSPRFSTWTTTYYHMMDGARSVYDMMRSTRIRPYLDELQNDAQRSAFEKLLLDAIDAAYQKLPSGKLVFPFKRLFFILLHP